MPIRAKIAAASERNASAGGRAATVDSDGSIPVPNFKLAVNAGSGDERAGCLAAKVLQRTDPVILRCRSGDSSAKATDLLARLAYTDAASLQAKG